MAVIPDNFFRHIDDFFNYRQDIYEISKIGDYDRSIRDNTKAIQINPHFKIAYMNRV